MNLEREMPIGVAGLGIVAASIGLTTLDAAVLQIGAVAAGLVLFGGGYARYRRAWDRADEIRIDERIERVAYRSGDLAFRASLGLAMVLFVAIEADGIPVTPKEGLVLLILGMVVARFGLYGWYREQSL